MSNESDRRDGEPFNDAQGAAVRSNREKLQSTGDAQNDLASELADYDSASTQYNNRYNEQRSTQDSINRLLSATQRNLTTAQTTLDRYNPQPRDGWSFGPFGDPGLSQAQIDATRDRMQVHVNRLAGEEDRLQGLYADTSQIPNRREVTFQSESREIVISAGQSDRTSTQSFSVRELQILARTLRDLEFSAAGSTVSFNDLEDGVNGARTQGLMQALGIDANRDGNYTQAELAELRDRVETAMQTLAEGVQPNLVPRNATTDQIADIATDRSRYTTIAVDSYVPPGTSAFNYAMRTELGAENATATNSFPSTVDFESTDIILTLEQRARVAALAERYRAQTAEYEQRIADAPNVPQLPSGMVLVHYQGTNAQGVLTNYNMLVPRGELEQVVGEPVAQVIRDEQRIAREQSTRDR